MLSTLQTGTMTLFCLTYIACCSYFTKCRWDIDLRGVLVPWEKVKTMDFSEIIAASVLKGSRRRHLIEYMKICEY